MEYTAIVRKFIPFSRVFLSLKGDVADFLEKCSNIDHISFSLVKKLIFGKSQPTFTIHIAAELHPVV